MDLSFILEDGTCLWHVGLVPDDEADSIFPGTTAIMGPDGKSWTFPYIPNFYDREIVERALTHLYIEGVADLFHPDSLCEQVEHQQTTGRSNLCAPRCRSPRGTPGGARKALTITSMCRDPAYWDGQREQGGR
jgi:hypothetical protein